jgi:SAM-dependent methyltransferase
MPDQPAFECGYCRGTDSRPCFECRDLGGQHWAWRTCRRCGAVAIAPRPSPQQLATAYSASYYGTATTKFRGTVEHFIDGCRRARARRLARGLPADAAVLDVGCGNGGFLSSLSELGNYRLCGTELDGPAACRAAGRAGISLHVGELVDADFAKASFDLVTLFHVFEHLAEPRRTLEVVHRILKPEGRLVLSFPNIGSMQARWFRGHWFHLDPPRHLFFFPPTAFAQAMEAAGFTIAAKRQFSIEQNPFGFIQSALNGLLSERDVLYERLKGNNTYAPQHGTWSLRLQKAFAAMCLPVAGGLDAVESALGAGATVEYTLSKAPENPEVSRG